MGEFDPLDPDQFTFGLKSNIRDASVVLTAGGEIRLAVTDNTIHEWPFAPDPPPHSVIVMRFDGSDGDLIDVQGLSPDQNGYPDFFNMNNVLLGTPGPGQESATGVAWINGGNKLLVTGREVDGTSWMPVITVYDMVTNSWLDLLPVLNIQGSLTEYVRARLYRNTPPNGEAGAIYIPHPGGLAAITGVDDGTYAFQAVVAGSSSAIPPVFDPPGGSATYLPRFINAQVTDDNSVVVWNSEACCEFRVSYEGYDGYDFPNVPGTYTWYGNNNPFGNCPEVIFLSDLVVPTGATLNIHDMVLRFAPTAHLIVQNGASANIFDTDLRPLECPEERWQGIRVEGVSSDLAQSENIQGRLKLDHSHVIGAMVGVWCKHEGSDQHFGGIVRAYYSSFEDCITDARIEKYHRYLVGQEWDNKCVFSNSQFLTTGDWANYGPALPGRHIELYSVNGVAVKRCAFVNANPGAWSDPLQRGWGIFSPQATFKCNGYTAYASNRFENLGVGVVVSNGDPNWAYELKGMGFANNFVGLYDMASVSSVITNNKLTTMSSQDPFAGASVGFYFYQSQGYICERNEFWDGDISPPEVPSVGIWFRGPATMENKIYDNDFHDCNVGNAVQGDHANTFGGVPPDGTGLQMLCGEYWNEIVDQFIMVDGDIRVNQGTGGNVNFTANNLFHQDVNCTGRFEPWVDPANPEPANFRYHYFAGSLAELRPECVETIDQGPDETWIGSHYDLIPTFEPDQNPFDAEQHCNGGVLDMGSGHIAEMLAAYRAKVDEHNSAIEAYQGQVDNGDKETPLEAIDADPAWPSHQLRDLLLLHSPLSDTVMIAAIRRAEPMDPWHLTQVLIANSRISGTIWTELDHTGVLPPYLYNLLLANQVNPSLRTILEDEIALRSDEKARVLRRVEISLYEDSLYVGKVDTLLNAYLADSMGTGLPLAYRLAVSQSRYAEAADIADRLEARDQSAGLIKLGELKEALAGDWEAASPAQRDLLWEWAFSGDREGSADAWALLWLLQETDSVPYAEIPPAYRTSSAANNRYKDIITPMLAAFPNPATDRAMVTLPDGMTGGLLELLDAQGRVVLNRSLAGSVAIAEVDLRDVVDGMYILRLSNENLVMGECKLTVAR